MHILEKLKGDGSGVTSETSPENADVQVKVAIIDAVAEVQSLDKPDRIKNCKHLAEHFCSCLFSKYDDNEEIRVISVQTCVAVLMIMNARTSKTTTCIRVTRMKVTRMREAMSQLLGKDVKNCK
jgi:hypothetical protein